MQFRNIILALASTMAITSAMPEPQLQGLKPVTDTLTSVKGMPQMMTEMQSVVHQANILLDDSGTTTHQAKTLIGQASSLLDPQGVKKLKALVDNASALLSDPQLKTVLSGAAKLVGDKRLDTVLGGAAELLQPQNIKNIESLLGGANQLLTPQNVKNINSLVGTATLILTNPVILNELNGILANGYVLLDAKFVNETKTLVTSANKFLPSLVKMLGGGK
ncbi:hypothetical protein FPQ18DRAFT_282740 [Pyronema domesticum]|uniref:Uncharacterized protein n=1 Tax=Pyronema omphalodes (strain CBS 100304) TaxID=1076935 RepID=U4LN85_PYROM|nr:hypothetical protein FPQ18DRAFT_282740 [Pyronema domesticum]CCX33393.1 Similar to hypothetical protein AOR_1_608184 [Aspergillus oryzae RIB40]; acc. no. XP_001816840 [Pyronema omphalodes CBS 100304]